MHFMTGYQSGLAGAIYVLVDELARQVYCIDIDVWILIHWDMGHTQDVFSSINHTHLDESMFAM